jgi:HK97 family phage major capsid protein
MSTYDQNVSRGTGGAGTNGTGAASLIPEDFSHEILKGVEIKSAALSRFKHRTMSRKQQRMPVLAAKPSAYFVNGDTGLKQTSKVNWENKYLNAEEIAVIVPVPEALLDDVDYDLWAEIKPELEEAIAVTLDQAVFFGTNAPASWPANIAAQATTVGNKVVKGASAIDVADDINNVMAKMEVQGFSVNGFWLDVSMKGILRGLRDKNNNPIFQPLDARTPQSSIAPAMLWGEPANYSPGGIFTGTTLAIAGDWDQGYIGIRQDMTYKVLDQAVLQDSTGAIQFNLAQQDMVALRVVCRFGFQVANFLTRAQTDETQRYPFSILTSS